MLPATTSATHTTRSLTPLNHPVTPKFVTALMGLRSMTSLLGRVGQMQLNLDREKQRLILGATLLLIIGTLFTIGLMLQKKPKPNVVDEAKRLFDKVLMLLKIRLAFGRISFRLSLLLQLLLAWILFLMACCEKLLRQFLARYQLKIMG